MKRYTTLLATLLLLAGTTATLAGAASGPLADAGLDQEVGVDTTVQIDGTGSSHPDGTIDRYEWSIETPSGREITPHCRDCARTRFTPNEPGRYEVTLAVTDAEGRTDADTLYVDVAEVGPSVELDGPTEPWIGESVTYDATAQGSNAELQTLTWTLDDRTVARESLNGNEDGSERPFSFTSADTYRLVVVVRDSTDRTARDTLTVEPRGRPDGSSGGDSDGDSGPAIETPSSSDESGDGCQVAGVVTGPGGTTAAVTCVDGVENDTFSDETCDASIQDCDHADPNGQDGKVVDADYGDIELNYGLPDLDNIEDSGNGDDGGDESGGSDGPDETKDSAGGNTGGGHVT